MTKQIITQADLKAQLHYNPDTGIFTRISNFTRKDRINSKAGSLHKYGYIHIKLYSKSYTAHRLAWLYMTGIMPSEMIDHINCIKDDNRWCNLRQASRSENNRNTNLLKTNKSGLKGVCWHKATSKWIAQGRINNKSIYLGVYETAKKASIVYENWAKNNHGEFYRNT